jgi:ABC-type Mn2+/Zn2+ transport system ATPase subunit
VSAAVAVREVDGRGDPLLVAEGLSLGYRRRPVVRGINLTVARGEFWFLLGPNGAGKSTFARAVLGFLSPLEGSLRLEGGLRRGESLGFVPQHSSLLPTLSTTLREFVGLGLGSRRGSRPELDKRVGWAIEAVGLDGRESQDVHDLSGGMRQRAMVARALVRRPPLLVLDEPTSNLDPASQEALLVVLARLRRETGLTLLFVCHDVAVAARYASHVAFFHDGIVEAGDRSLLLEADVLRRVYGLDICVSLDAAGHATLHIESPESMA